MIPRALPLLVLAGALLRLPWLVGRPLWLDEGLQHWIASAPDALEVVSRTVAQDLHPPGYALLAHAALSLTDTDAALRLPSFLAGIASIAVAWLAGRAWTGERGAWLTAGVAAAAPPLVAWSREGRPYAVAVLALFALLWAAGRHRARPSDQTTAWLAAAAVAAAPWQYGAWLAVAGILGGLALDPAARRGAGVAAASFCAAAAPIAVFVAVPQWRAAGFPAHLREWTGLSGLLIGLPSALGWLAVGAQILLLPLLGLGVMAALGLALRRAHPVLRAVAAGPVVLLGLAAIVGIYPLGPVRHALVLAPALAVALGTLRPDPRVGAVAVGALTLATLAVAPGVPVYDTPALLASLAEVRRPGEVVWVHPMLSWPVRRYGAPEEPVIWGRWGEPPKGTWVLAPTATSLPNVALRADGVVAARSP